MRSKQKPIHSNNKGRPEFSFTVEDEVGWIVFNRPHVRNAISREIWDAIPNALNELQSKGARLIVFRGEGGAFAAGADLSELTTLNSEQAVAEHWGSIRAALNAVASCEIPTIAKITGPCMGGGCLLALACDLRFGAEDTVMSVPVAQLGIQLDHDNIARLISVVGRGIASQMLFTGAEVRVERAIQVGLLNGHDADLPAVVKHIKRNSSASIRATKCAITQICQRGRVDDDQGPVVASYLSEDTQQRVARALSRKS